MRDVWEAMSDKTRREILSMLKERDLSAGEIADSFSLTKATVSHHLSVLKAAGLVDSEKHAQTVVYSLNMTAFQSFLLTVNAFFSDKNFRGSTVLRDSPGQRSAAERRNEPSLFDEAPDGSAINAFSRTKRDLPSAEAEETENARKPQNQSNHTPSPKAENI